MILSPVFMAIQDAFVFKRANFLVKEVHSHGGKYSKEVQNISKKSLERNDFLIDIMLLH